MIEFAIPRPSVIPIGCPIRAFWRQISTRYGSTAARGGEAPLFDSVSLPCRRTRERTVCLEIWKVGSSVSKFDSWSTVRMMLSRHPDGAFLPLAFAAMASLYSAEAVSSALRLRLSRVVAAAVVVPFGLPPVLLVSSMPPNGSNSKVGAAWSLITLTSSLSFFLICCNW